MSKTLCFCQKHKLPKQRFCIETQGWYFTHMRKMSGNSSKRKNASDLDLAPSFKPYAKLFIYII